jgi:hypothetical protein
MQNFLLFTLVFIFTNFSFAFQYQTEGECDGYPKVKLKTAPGFCLGIVYEPNTQNQQLVTPLKLRWAVELKDHSLLVSDIVSFGGRDGFVYRLFPTKGNGVSSNQLQVLFSYQAFKNLPINDFRHRLLYQPNQMILWKDQKVYLGTSSGIFRFDPYASDPIRSMRPLGRVPRL